MISQLGMEGKWTTNKNKHTNFRIYFGYFDSVKNRYISDMIYYFQDSRHFGNFSIWTNLTEISKKHGPCLLTTALKIQSPDIPNKNTNDLDEPDGVVTLKMFSDKLKNRRIGTKRICDFLMEQKHFSGVGNYLRAEILYRAKINPNTILDNLNENHIEILYSAIIKQMILSYQSNGLTIKTYVNGEGEKGNCPLQVYNKSHDPYGNKIYKFLDKQNRTVHWCPDIQI